MTTIYLIRHAHAIWTLDDDRPLSAPGIDAAARVADRLAREPIAAIYTSPSRRSLQTVEPLAQRLGLTPSLIPDLRERELPVVPRDKFETLVRASWKTPDVEPDGGESNVRAQARGLGVVRTVVARHPGSHVVLGTHGNLLALVMHALDSRFGYEFWQGLSFPEFLSNTTGTVLETQSYANIFFAAGNLSNPISYSTTITTISAVPELSTYLLLTLGALASLSVMSLWRMRTTGPVASTAQAPG